MFDPASFLKVAEELSLAATDEAKLRTSICRSYFYTFLYSREWLKSQGMTFKNKSEDHALAHKGLQKYVNRATKDLLSDLRRNYRNEADYNLTKVIQQQEAKDAIDLAKKVISNINTVVSSPQQSSPQTP